MDRFFFPEAARLIIGQDVRLDGREGHHARVKREAVGDRVRLFDGEGAEVEARVREVARDGLALVVERTDVTPPAASVPVTLCVALPKGKRALVLLEKATELGVAALRPLVSGRTVGAARAGMDGLPYEKWRRRTIEAAKQSGAARLPDLLEPRSLADALREDAVGEGRAGGAEGAEGATGAPSATGVVAGGSGALKLLLDPAGDALPLRDALPRERPRAAIVLVGPEGGFTKAEVEAARAAGFRPVRLGATILRIETAAIAVLAALVVAYD